jgi:hypothetical protein
MQRATVDPIKFNPAPTLPYDLRIDDFRIAMQDVYDFFHDVNVLLSGKGLPRLDDMLRPAAMSGIISDMLTASVAKHSRALVENQFHNGHPDLVLRGRYPHDAVQSGTDGVEIKSTRRAGRVVDTHGARDQWMCVFVYEVDYETEPAIARRPMRFREVYLAQVSAADFRRNLRGELGTRTASLGKEGARKLRANWVYLDR